MHARYTDVFYVFLSFPFPGVDGVSRYTDGGRGCYSGYRTQGYVAQWLERLAADQQVPGSIPGGGHGLSS